MHAKTQNLPVIGLFISIFIAIIMGFVMGALIENLVLKDINSDIEKILEQPTKISIINSTVKAAKFYASLIATEPLIVGFNIIDLDGEIVFSDELSLLGTTFSEKGKISKAIKNKNYYTVDRNLISQETILKEEYKSLLILFYHFEDIGITIQILYDISSNEKDIKQITSLLWFTILLSVAILFILLVYISNLTRRTLQKAKEDLEIEVIKRTRDLEKLSASLDKEVKKRTMDLKSTYKELLQKAAFMTNNPAPVMRMDYSGEILEFNPSAKNLFNKDLIGLKINRILSNLNITSVNNLKTNQIFHFEQRIGEKIFLFAINKHDITRSYYIYGSNITEIKKSHEILNLQNKDLMRKSMDLTELRGQLEDKNIDLQSAFNSLNRQNKDLIKSSMDLTELQAQLDDKNFELEKANKEILDLMEARTEFINRAAHDLRTPITPILVLLPTIKKRIKDIGILFDLKVIERNANYLKNIADNLINYLKAKTQKYDYDFKKTDIRDILEYVLLTYKEVFKQRRITVINKIPKKLPLIEFDELRITEVIQNIVSNALKFMPRVGKFTISVNQSKEVICLMSFSLELISYKI